ncbi:MAG: efflux RND transporter periplasmic adaptor subunit [Oscillospiraceae bacterium]|nr:efflux RND transporter periplasmic adaptor subunit [Oscillospiraceae bacterium]
MKKIKVKKILKAAGGLAFAGLIVWFMTMKINLDTSTSNYDFVLPFEKRDLNTFINASGTVEMNNTTIVTSDVIQKLKTVNCRVGDVVKQGDILCEFESGDLDSQIQKLQKLIDDSNAIRTLNQSNTDSGLDYAKHTQELLLEKAQIALDNANSEYNIAAQKYNDYYQLYYNCSDNDLSAQYYEIYRKYEDSLEELSNNIDQCQTTLDNVKFSSDLSVQSAESQKRYMELEQSGIDEYSKQLDKLISQKNNLVVKAATDGIISESYAFEGSYTINGNLFRIGKLDDYKLDALIFSKDILKVESGMNVVFTTKLTGSQEIKGVITSVTDVYDTRGYSAQIEIQDDEMMKLLKPDINANIKIFTSQTGVVPAVAYDSIFTDDSGKKFVYVAEKNSKGEYTAHAKEVETGAETDYYVEITSGELADGDLIVGDAENHSEGDKIKLKGAA